MVPFISEAVSSCFLLVLVTTTNWAFHLPRVLLLWSPCLYFLPGYWPIRILLNQYNWQIFTEYKSTVPQQYLTYFLGFPHSLNMYPLLLLLHLSHGPFDAPIFQGFICLFCLFPSLPWKLQWDMVLGFFKMTLEGGKQCRTYSRTSGGI